MTARSTPIPTRISNTPPLTHIPPRPRCLRRLRTPNLLRMPRNTLLTIRIMVIALPMSRNPIRLRRILLQILIRHHIQRALIARVQMHLRHRIIRELSILCSLHRFLEPRGAETPFHARGHAGVFEVVALRGGEVEEVLRDGRRDAVVAFVFGCDSAVAIAEEACGWVLGEEAESAAGD